MLLDVLPDGIEQQVGAAVLVEGEQPGRGHRRLGLDRERSIFDQIRVHDRLEPSPQPLDQLAFLGDEVVGGPDAHFGFDRSVIRVQIRGGIARPGDLTRRPGAEVGRSQPRRPSAPENRSPADAVGQSRKGLIAEPGVSPNQVLRARIWVLRISIHDLFSRSA